MKKIFFFSFLLFLPLFSAQAQKQGELSLNPKVIDDSAAPREMLEYTLKLKNNAEYKLNIYPLLNELKDNKPQDTQNLLARQYMMTEWISIKRSAIEVLPGEEISLPLEIDISADARPGDYFVSITFAHGSHRLDAEENAIEASPPRLLINLIVEDQSVEKASIMKFFPDKKIFFKSRPDFSSKINNSGNVSLLPEGNIYVYNKRGEELDYIPINPDLEQIPSGEIKDFFSSGKNNLNTGRYKARLELEYGTNSKQNINDVVYFIIITPFFAAFFGVGIFLFVVLLSLLIFRKTYHHHPGADLSSSEPLEKKHVSAGGDVIDLKK